MAEAAAATANAPALADRQKALADAAEIQRQAATEQSQRLEEERKKVAESRAGASKVNAFKEAELKAKEEKERKLRAMMDKMSARDGSPAPDVCAMLSISWLIDIQDDERRKAAEEKRLADQKAADDKKRAIEEKVRAHLFVIRSMFQ